MRPVPTPLLAHFRLLTLCTRPDYPSVPAEGNDLTASAPTIVLDLKRVLVPAGMPWNGKKTTVRLESAQLCEPDAGFEILRTRIRAWAEEFGFEAWSSRCVARSPFSAHGLRRTH